MSGGWAGVRVCVRCEWCIVLSLLPSLGHTLTLVEVLLLVAILGGGGEREGVCVDGVCDHTQCT